MKRVRVGAAVVALAFAFAATAAEQVWSDSGADNVWSTNAPNWDSGAVWENGSQALFTGGAGSLLGEAVDVAAVVSVAGVTFQTNGYAIVDADKNGTFLLAGAPSVFTVQGAANTAAVAVAVGGSGGLTKAGAGVLNLTVTNTYAGVTTVSAGILRLADAVVLGLGATGTGNDTVVESGAALDFNGCYVNATSAEKFTISGVGPDSKGALVNTGRDMTNKNLQEVILSDDATIGGPRRIDVGTLTGNANALTKTGAHQLCLREVANVEIVLREGMLTLLDNANALGGSTWGDTFVYGGTLNCWNTRTYTERVTFYGGNVAQGNTAHTFYLAGPMTLHSNVTHNSAGSRGVELSGYMDGPGGLTQASDGWFIVTGDTNAYTGPTTVNSGKSLWVGRTNLYAGVLGYGTVTNWGTLYAQSRRLSQGDIVNSGTIFLNTGLLSTAGNVLNNGNLYIQRGGECTFSNSFSGTGTITVRSNATVMVSGGCSTNSQLFLGYGGFSLTNGALFRFTGEMQVADRLNLGYAIDPTNVTAIMDIAAGCTLMAQCITFGNGTNVVNGGMTSVVNQAGTVVTTGRAAEDNGIRLGHYPQAYSVYNMRAGTLVVGADWDLGCATDGAGWFNMTGGEVFAKRVMLNERDNAGGFGRFTLAGGVVNVGSLTGSTLALSNGICADKTAPYQVVLGGAGGTIRAVTNVEVSVSATLVETGAEAVTFDTQGWRIEATNVLSGAGGLNKAGSGTLVLGGGNTYAGPTRVLAGALVRSGLGGVPAGGAVLFGVTADDAGGRLHSDGDLSLAGIVVGVANPEELDKAKSYTIATYGGALTAGVEDDSLPGPWYVYYDWPNKRVQLKAAVGTLIRLY